MFLSSANIIENLKMASAKFNRNTIAKKLHNL